MRIRQLIDRGWHRLGDSGWERTVRGLLLLAIFCLPFGTVWIISESQAVVSGTHNAFAVPRLYAVEVLMVLAALLWAWHRPNVSGHLRPFKPLLGVLALAAITFIWAPYPLLAAVTFGHLFVGFVWVYVLSQELRDRKFFRTVAWTLTASAALQALWAIGQYSLNHDLALQLLGESTLRPDLHGVAKVVRDGQAHLRGYGSLPHPNLLAAYLSVAIFWVGTVVFWPGRKSKPGSLKSNLALGGLLALLAAGLLVTFSRAAIVLVVVNGALAILYSLRRWHRLPVGAAVGAIGFLIAAVLLWQPLTGRTTLESSRETGVTNRTVGYELAADAIQNRPLGVGAGNFVLAVDELRSNVPDYQHQPAHNALLLVTAEVGILAGALLAWFVIRLGWLFHFLKHRDRKEQTLDFSLFVLAGTFIGLGLVDHFFWSLPQGLWLVALVTAAVISRIPEDRWEARSSARP